MRRRRIVERDEVLPPPAHVRLAAWRALHRPTVTDMTPEDAQASASSLMAWAAQYRAAMDAQADARIARLRAEGRELRMQLEPLTDTRYARARAALAGVAVLLVSLLLPAQAWAQYAPDQLRLLQPSVLAVGEEVRAAYPSAWRAAHNAGEPAGSEYVRRWALALRARGITACVNGKRGSDTLSQDVLVFPVTAGGNRDTSGQYAQIAIIDVIGGAGGPNPTLGWNDVSAASQGKCIAPYLDPGESGGVPVPVPPVVTPPPAQTDLAEVLVALSRIEDRLAAIESRPVPSPDLGALPAYIDAMVGGGPDGDGPLPPHVTDVKERLDVIRVQLEQLTAWLRGRAILRY